MQSRDGRRSAGSRRVSDGDGNSRDQRGTKDCFPKVARCLTLSGADLICWPCSWRSPQDYGLIATERVLENRTALVASNRLDSAASGPSLILQSLLSRSSSSTASWRTEPGRPDIVTALLNLAISRSKRIYNNTDVLFDRQPQYYGRLTRESNEEGAATVASRPMQRSSPDSEIAAEERLHDVRSAPRVCCRYR